MNNDGKFELTVERYTCAVHFEAFKDAGLFARRCSCLQNKMNCGDTIGVK